MKTRGLEVVDASCPYVEKIHDLVNKKYKEGYQIIIAGDKTHPEIIGINGWCDNSAFIIENEDNVDDLPDIKKRYVLLHKLHLFVINGKKL